MSGDGEPELYSKLDPAMWLPDPQPEDVPGRRWTFVGAPGAEMEGVQMTVTMDDE
jgi:hypothetical protein